MRKAFYLHRLLFVCLLFVIMIVAAPAQAKSLSLSSQDVRLYKEIFEYQKNGAWDKADERIARLSDKTLMGHVLYQRYLHPTAYRSSYAELAAWLNEYADHPGAGDIFRLANTRRPSSAPAPKRPQTTSGLIGNIGDSYYYTESYSSPRKRTQAEKNMVAEIQKNVRADLRRRAPTRALARLNEPYNQKLLDPVEIDIMKGRIALSYFYLDRLQLAYETGSAAADRSGQKTGMAAWIAGLAAWKMKKYDEAAKYFDIAANSKHLSDWTASASAYWASRAYWRIREPQKVNEYLRKAAQFPRTFYGLIALEALGRPIEAFQFSIPKKTRGHLDRVAAHPAGHRAILLQQIGQNVLAELELRQIHPRGDSQMEEALVSFAHERGFAGLAIRLASAVKSEDGQIYDGVFFPVGDWQPKGGYTIDRALIHALIRQESRFNPHAESPSGATGLMQLMPATASHVTGENFRGNNRRRLLEPNLNIAIGQKYLRQLMQTPDIRGDMFKLLVAYNAGPGNLRRWLAAADYDDDPLFFIETIPVAETRAFVEMVMTNYWIYRLRFDQNAPALTAVAAGLAPIYIGQEHDDLKFAGN